MVITALVFGTKDRYAGKDQQRFSSQLSLWRIVVVRTEKLVAEAGESSGTQRKVDVSRWKPLPSEG
jgi:hypothetical protein